MADTAAAAQPNQADTPQKADAAGSAQEDLAGSATAQANGNSSQQGAMDTTPQVDDDAVKVGDLVIMYGGKQHFKAVEMKSGEVFNTKWGSFPHSSVIGKPYGSKIICNRNKGFIHVLRPTPELWTAGALTHRTQIIYSTDISLITFLLQIRPGSRVAEAGTGSGSMSMGLCRVVAPSGHLFTFEFHEERAESARKLFQQAGLQDHITVTHRDVCADGFGFGTGEEVDALFLDVPSPWAALPHAHAALRLGGMVCTFSPCIEQVQRTCEVFHKGGFSDIETVECLARAFEVHSRALDPLPEDIAASLMDAPAGDSAEPPDAKKRKRDDGPAFPSAALRRVFSKPIADARRPPPAADPPPPA
eukprot:CAMPEP_0177682650 /NCGR_PEP_ID=MMETSP0447-20121125/31367_1 /TAXON_ID=0 /ORGANISM="Stygamoeba regulata, Strain BSH-02190019" /LENGTH=360 /DNA_ID=CAMNT_0019192157 /DNA_START=46 /DNA_END=1125 /DNA_ORIENTATION=+